MTHTATIKVVTSYPNLRVTLFWPNGNSKDIPGALLAAGHQEAGIGDGTYIVNLAGLGGQPDTEVKTTFSTGAADTQSKTRIRRATKASAQRPPPGSIAARPDFTIAANGDVS